MIKTGWYSWPRHGESFLLLQKNSWRISSVYVRLGFDQESESLGQWSSGAVWQDTIEHGTLAVLILERPILYWYITILYSPEHPKPGKCGKDIMWEAKDHEIPVIPIRQRSNDNHTIYSVSSRAAAYAALQCFAGHQRTESQSLVWRSWSNAKNRGPWPLDAPRGFVDLCCIIFLHHVVSYYSAMVRRMFPVAAEEQWTVSGL